jgi:hypothetical protein
MIEVRLRMRCGYSMASVWAMAPAHRCTDYMRRVDAERVEQADHVARHVAEGVGRADWLASQMRLQQLWHVGYAQAFEAGGQSDVTVIESDDAEPARR